MQAVVVTHPFPSPAIHRFCLLTVALASIFLAGCSESQSAANKAPKVSEVGVVTLTARPLTLNTELPGRTAAHMVAQIRPQVGGIVQRRVFTEGALVKKGELLYQIDPASYEAALASAKASVARAEATRNAARQKAKRQADLFAIAAISQQDDENAQVALEQADADLASARAALQVAQINLARTRITSPINGRTETSSVTQGALVTANQEKALTTVQQLDPIYVDIPQSSVQVLQLRRALTSGQLEKGSTAGGEDAASVSILLEDGSVYAHEGKLQFAGVTVNETTGAVTLRALVPNPEHLLMPGMYVRARLSQGTDPQALLVPQQAIGRDAAGRATALVVLPDGKVALRGVTVAEVVGQNWRVTSGLAAGDMVIVEGSAKVKPGQTVHAVSVELDGARAVAQVDTEMTANAATPSARRSSVLAAAR